MKENNIKLSESLILFFLIMFILFLGIGLLKIDLQVVLLLCLFLTIIYSIYKGYSFDFIVESMSKSISRSYEALLIFVLIGATIGVWILSGTIPSLIYYGLNILSPNIFLPAGLIICSLTSVATGTSWGTVSTVGIALISIGESIGIPSPITAGMIVSGAFFGDKISPMSDTTNLSDLSTNTKLYDHIYSMLYTTVPAYLISLVIYTLIGLNYSASDIDFSKITTIKETLSSTFNISIITFLPIIFVLILSVMKKPTVLAMFVGVLVGIFVSILFQGNSLSETLNIINSGYNIPTNIEIVDKIILRGGVQSMMYTFSLTFIALSIGGILSEIGYLKVIVENILIKVKNLGNLILLTIVSCFLSNIVVGEAYLSIIINANLYKEEYKKRNLKSSMLSRTIEEGATLTTVLIPWTTAGAFISASLSVGVFEYVPFAFFNLINPILSIIFAYSGIFILKNSK